MGNGFPKPVTKSDQVAVAFSIDRIIKSLTALTALASFILSRRLLQNCATDVSLTLLLGYFRDLRS